MNELERIKTTCLSKLEEATGAKELETVYWEYLGRKGKLTAVLRSLKDLPLGERRRIGPKAQKLKIDLEVAFEKKEKGFLSEAAGSSVDLTAPPKKVFRGHLHPLTLVEQEVRHIFRGMNFSVADGPEAESEYYNFDALNIPPDHPAREAWDTFWLKAAKSKEQRAKSKNNNYLPFAISHKPLLRTHTSPAQVRYMETHTPPFRIIVPGRVFRYEATDASHETNFYQLEGLAVGKDVNLANFKFVVEEFFKKFFGKEIEFRYRPSYFPFVEPGIEVDIRINAKSQILNSKSPVWLEVMGAGMVHPRVFEYAHYNPRDWQGFAFGVGLDRLAMIKYKIPDIRLFYSGDLRFIRQF